jgi:cobalamin biosynthesis protein CobD/CbiB
MSLIYILLPLFWFIKEITTVDEQKITDKQRFWVSTGMLFWIIFFIFKMIPLYFFNKQDLEFLLVLDNIYQIATIISYLIFFKSLYHR